MSNAIRMIESQFESQKNMRATLYTAGVCMALLLFFFMYKWQLPVMEIPPVEEGMEVNLGNSDMGLGTDQAFLPGPPAPNDQQAYTPPKTSPAPVENVKDIATDDNDPDAPAIRKPSVLPKPNATKVAEKDIVKNKPVKNPQPVTNPAPPKPKPKAVFKGVNGTGTGGNDADSYKKGGNQGIAGGNGDQGRPGGDPNASNYEGAGGNGSGVSIARGLRGRKMVSLPSFQDDFNENAKVAIDIRVDANGKVISAIYQPLGSTTASNTYKNIAIRKAMQIKFNSGGEESVGTLVFNFKIHN